MVGYNRGYNRCKSRFFCKKCKIFLKNVCSYQNYLYLCNTNKRQNILHIMTYIKNFDKNGKTYRYIDTVNDSTRIVKESEKAVCLRCNVRFNDNEPKARDLWFPKSVIALDGQMFGVAEWFYEKTSSANAFHGYRMQFDATLFQA